jgi:hypothetical protein
MLLYIAILGLVSAATFIVGVLFGMSGWARTELSKIIEQEVSKR